MYPRTITKLIGFLGLGTKLYSPSFRILNHSLNQHEKGSHQLTETESARTLSAPYSSVYVLWTGVWFLCLLLVSFPSLCFAQLQCDSFYFIISWFVRILKSRNIFGFFPLNLEICVVCQNCICYPTVWVSLTQFFWEMYSALRVGGVDRE